MAANAESEVLAQQLNALGGRMATVETRLAEVDKVIARLEVAARTTARSMEEISHHWDAVYEAMRRAEGDMERSHKKDGIASENT